MYRPLASKEPNPPTWVSELIDHTSMTWKVDVVRHFFHEIDSEAILQIPLSMRKQDDCWAWLHEKSGLFTIRSTYRMLIKAKKTREDYFESKDNCSDVERSQKEWCNDLSLLHPRQSFFIIWVSDHLSSRIDPWYLEPSQPWESYWITPRNAPR